MVLRSRNGQSRRRNNAAKSDNSPISAPLRQLEAAYREVDARKAEAYRRGILPEHPTVIEHGPLRVILSASPTPQSLQTYINTLAVSNVTHVVRVCEPYYSADDLTSMGFQVHDWYFRDGDAPPQSVVDQWLTLLDAEFGLRAAANAFSSSAVATSEDEDDTSEAETTASPSSSADTPKKTVAIHCAAGLGRAPVLVALALVELGLEPFEAVGWLRATRRGAINGVQLAYVQNYVRRPPPTPPTPPSKQRNRFWASLKASSRSRSLRTRRTSGDGASGNATTRRKSDSENKSVGNSPASPRSFARGGM